MFVKDEKGNFTGKVLSLEPDNLVFCLARIINERQNWGHIHNIPLYFPGDILHDMEFINAGISNEYFLQVCEYGTQISRKEDWDRVKAQWIYYTSGHKLVGIFLIRKEDDGWRIQEIYVDDFLNHIEEGM